MGVLVDTAGATADAALLRAAREGDQAAYGELFERYYARIYNYAYGIAGNPDDAADIAQDAFVRVFQALPRVTGELNFSAYLYRTAHNAAIDTVKHRSRFVPPELLDLQTEPALRADPERVALVQEQQDQAWRAAFALSDNHRAILTLRELHDMSYQEIAEVLDMPRTTVGVLLSRARLKFKEAFRMSSIDTENLVKECRDMLPLLSAYLDDELDQAGRDRVESHLAPCAFCRLALEEMSEASRSYRVIVPLFPPARAEAATWARLSDAAASRRAEAAAEQAGMGTEQARTSPRRAAVTRRGSKLVAGGLAAAAIVILGVSVAGGMSALSAYRATSTTTSASVAALSVDPGPEQGAAAEASSASATGTGVSTTWAVTQPPSTAASATVTGALLPTSTTRAATPTTSPETRTTPSTAPDTDPQTPAGASTSTTPGAVLTDTEPPPTPSLASPANGAVIDGGQVKLVWRAVKDPSGVTYLVDIQRFDGKTYVPLQTIGGLSGTSVGHTMTSTLERWRVTAVDGSGNASDPSGWWTISQPLRILTPSTGLTLLTPSTGLSLLTTSTTGLY